MRFVNPIINSFYLTDTKLPLRKKSAIIRSDSVSVSYSLYSWCYVPNSITCLQQLYRYSSLNFPLSLHVKPHWFHLSSSFTVTGINSLGKLELICQTPKIITVPCSSSIVYLMVSIKLITGLNIYEDYIRHVFTIVYNSIIPPQRSLLFATN
jgi:hypothetical protein